MPAKRDTRRRVITIFLPLRTYLRMAVKLTRLSCHRFRANEVRLWLTVIAYTLGNLWQRLALPKRIATWSLTSVQQRLVQTGGRLIKHARYYWLLLAEGHLTRRLFGSTTGSGKPQILVPALRPTQSRELTSPSHPDAKRSIPTRLPVKGLQTVARHSNLPGLPQPGVFQREVFRNPQWKFWLYPIKNTRGSHRRRCVTLRISHEIP